MSNSLATAALKSLDPGLLKDAYARVRLELAADPLFMRDAASYGVCLEGLDAKMKSAPSSPDKL